MRQAYSLGGKGLLVAVAMLCSIAKAAEGDIPPMPWQVAGTNHLIVGVIWNDAVLKLIPKGLSATPERTGGINIYHSTRGYGISPYQSGYGWIDLAGNDAADGSKARYIFRAGVGPNEKVTKAIMQSFGPAAHNGGTKLEDMGDMKQGMGMMDGVTWGTVRIKVSDNCQNAAGTLNYFMPSMDGSTLRRMQIPWSAVFCAAEPVSAEIAFPDAAASPVKPEKLIWAGEIREGAFTLSTPMPVK